MKKKKQLQLGMFLFLFFLLFYLANFDLIFCINSICNILKLF